MAISYERGQELGSKDLFVIIRDGLGVYTDVLEIEYEIFYNNDCEQQPMASMETQDAVRFGVGQYYAPVKVPVDAPIGTYTIRWNIKKDNLTNRYAIENKFNVKKLKRC